MQALFRAIGGVGKPSMCSTMPAFVGEPKPFLLALPVAVHEISEASEGARSAVVPASRFAAIVWATIALPPPLLPPFAFPETREELRLGIGQAEESSCHGEIAVASTRRLSAWTVPLNPGSMGARLNRRLAGRHLAASGLELGGGYWWHQREHF